MDKKIIGYYEETMHIPGPHYPQADKIFEGLNKAFGYKDGKVPYNEKIIEAHREASHKLMKYCLVKVYVRVFSDGSREFSLEKFKQ